MRSFVLSNSFYSNRNVVDWTLSRKYLKPLMFVCPALFTLEKAREREGSALVVMVTESSPFPQFSSPSYFLNFLFLIRLFLGSGAWSVLLGLNGPCAGDCVRGVKGGCCERPRRSGAWSVLSGLNGPCAGDCVRGVKGGAVKRPRRSGAWSVLLGLNGPCAGDCVRGSERGGAVKGPEVSIS
ncbi:hypothetical protein CEXT_763781 [Caerostris extrusa]|uniref:Uncharacterized protein n=1 Tax=Caerostris extrusa TaxID=172846 RepID=A0AAV4WAD3_CAEEX|nr:hypothetical protein CEXT_763781 [Caerostris extrusa]